MSKENIFIEYKKKFVVLTLSIIILIFLVEIPLTYYQARYIVCSVDILLLLINLSIIFHYYVKREIEFTSYALAVNFFCVSILVLLLGAYVDIEVYKWGLLMPSLIYYLIGFKKAQKYIFSIILIYFGFTILAFLDFLPKVSNKHELLQVTIAMFIFSIIAHFFQKMNFETQRLISEKNDKLQNALDQLNRSQQSLIESEKLASLGSLVAGVSHEINTPIGGSLTGISQIKHETKAIESAYQSNEMDEDSFLKYIQSTYKLSVLVEKNLQSAASLVKSFKAISVDQHKDDLREINLKDYIDQVITTLHSELKYKNIKIHNNIDEKINLNTYAGIYSQIFSNLILNASKHAFVDKERENIIDISAKIEANRLKVYFKDNGVGVDSDIIKKLFDPFFTTTRGQGGSGLGLNIVYNLITSKLHGTIEVDRTYKDGLAFKIEIGRLNG